MRAIGPEPWNAAYVEPSRRPADGRYGENPNRLYQHHQFQVVMKPSPSNIQELYLESLERLGINPLEHDIRFVEDNWENPSTGSAGLGWEVWLDGMEITQFTYFQQVGGLATGPVTAEVTYGLERLASYIQEVDSVYDIEWADGVKYGEIFIQPEYEHSKYSFEVSDQDMLLENFTKFEKEAERALEEGLVHPAFDYVLKCSQRLQELYLESLERLGINPLEHDIRFVEDNWENPSTGSAGLGWEVWLDGMEITQFTYFQTIGYFGCDRTCHSRSNLWFGALGFLYPRSGFGL